MLRQQNFFAKTNNKIIDMKNIRKDELNDNVETVDDQHKLDREAYREIINKKNKYEQLIIKFSKYSKYILIVLALIIVLNMSQVFVRN